MKKLAIALLALVMVVCAIGVVACDDGGEALGLYIFKLEGQTVSGEFELPREIGGKRVSWTSDNENLIKITDRSGEDMDYLAKVTRPEDKRTEVKLTVALGKNTRTFSVYVAPVSVFDFSGSYNFPQYKGTVTKTFDLDSEVEFEGKKATIAWKVKDEYKDFIKVENGKCVVTPSSLNPEVRLTATFTYGNDHTDKDYRFTVSIEKTHAENVEYWYNNTGVSIDIKGWVVAVGTAYSEQYNNINLYVVDEDNCSGYYVYRVKPKNKEDGAKVKVGSYVNIVGTTNTAYNGLIETNADGTFTLDTSKDKTAEQMDALCYNLDNDIVGKVPEAIYHTSQYVSLTNWKVKEVKEAVSAVDNKDLLVLTKNGVDVTVRTSKYLESAYKDANSDVFKGIIGLQTSLKAGDIVNAKGILSNNKGFTLLPVKGSDVAKVTDGKESTDAEIAAMPGVKVGNFINTKDTGLKAVVEKGGLNLIITKAKNVNLPASTDDVTVKYSIVGESEIITLDGTTLKIAAPVKHERVHVQADLTCGEYKTTYFFYVEVWNKTDAQMVEDEITELFVDTTVDLLSPSVTPLQTEGTKYGANTAITWAVKDAANTPYAKIDKNNLVISTTTIKDAKVTIVATIKVGSEKGTKEFTLNIPNVLTKVDDPAKDKAYTLTINQVNTNKTLYAKASINSSGYMTAVEDSADADSIFVEIVDAAKHEVKLYFKNGSKKLYLGAERAPGSNDATRFFSNLVIGEKVDTVWTLTDLCIKTTINKHKDEAETAKATYEVYMGTYSTNNRFSLSETSYINAGNAGVSQFPAYFAEVGKIADLKDEDVANYALNSLTLTNKINRPGDTTLSTVANFAPATVTWTFKAATTVATIDGGKLKVAALPAADTKVTLVATVKVGEVTKTKEFEVTISKPFVPVVDKVAAADVAADTAYKLVIDQIGLNQQLFIQNKMSGYYGATATKLADGDDVYAELVEGGVKLYFKNGEKKIYIGAEKSGQYYNLKFGETYGTVWTLDIEKNCIKTNLGTESEADWVYIGTYGTYNTLSVSQISKLGDTSYPAYLATPKAA